MANKELLSLPIEMPEDDGSEPSIVKPDRQKPGEKPDLVLDPGIIASSNTPEEIRRWLETNSETEAIDKKKEK